MKDALISQNAHAAWRSDVARKLLEVILTFEGVEGVVIAGSVARGFADVYSDLEMPIFWQSEPDEDKRRELVRKLRGEFLYGSAAPLADGEDQLWIDGFQVDLWHNQAALEDRVIDAVLRDYSTDLGDSNFMDTLRCCIPLHGFERIAGWKVRAQEYPQALAERNISLYLPAFRLRELELYAARDVPVAYFAELCHLQQAMFQVLLALNLFYFPTYKWMGPTIERMPLKPRDLNARLRRAYQAPAAEALVDTRAQMEEILELVEARHPAFDTAPTRRLMQMSRPRWEGPPSGGLV
jgi:hypothetical protein